MKSVLRSPHLVLWLTLFILLVESASVSIAGDGPTFWSKAWWTDRATDPPGARQHEKDGKLWPPYPRPQGRHQTFVHQYHHSHYWPYPYSCQDRGYIEDTLTVQATNGWADAMTLQECHFNAESQELNSSGQSLLYWILTSAPPEYRAIYVNRSGSIENDQARMASVQQAAAAIDPAALSLIQQRISMPTGRPAQEIDRLQQLDLQTMPRPRLQMTVGVQNNNSTMGSAASSSTPTPSNTTGGSGSTGIR